MNIKAATTFDKGSEFIISDVSLDKPKYGEVLVRVRASGICHTDLRARDQLREVPLPIILGHEGSGVVEEVGEGVSNVQPGDHVIMSFNSCGTCDECLNARPYACKNFPSLNFSGKMRDGTHRHSIQDESVNTFFGQSSFATYSIVSDRSVVKVDKEVPIDLLGPLGCGIQTGSGTVMNKLKPNVGETIAIIGCGTVGLSALMAAKILDCGEIIAVDVHDNRLKLAETLGATQTINAAECDVNEKILEITKTGVDYVVDSSGVPDVLTQALNSVSQSGTVAVVGGASLGTMANVDMGKLLFERTITGVIEGNSIPQVFIPKLIHLYKAGKFPFDKLIQFYDVDDINTAVQDMEEGKVIKPVIRLFSNE